MVIVTLGCVKEKEKKEICKRKDGKGEKGGPA
jgi:hypothetical protein